jgi:HK97 family phage major capsid protein
MSSDSMTLPRELAKVSVTYSAEEENATETEPTFSQVTLTARRMDAYAVSSNELIQDNNIPGGIVGILMSQFTEAVGQKIDSTVFIGSGADSAVFSGVFLTTGYSEVFSSGSTHFSELLESNIRNIVAAVPERYIRQNGKWYVGQSVLWKYIRGLKDDNGNYMFAESKYGRAAPDMLWGYPVEKPTVAPSTSAKETGYIVFGNLKAVWIGDRLTNIDLMVDPYTGAKSYQTYWYLFTRWAYAHALPNMLGRIVTAGS